AGKGKKAQPQFKAEDMVALYETQGARIFYRSPWRAIRTVGGALDEKYPTEGVESVLEEYFGDTMLSEALTNVMVTSYEIEQRAPFFFKSTKAKLNASDDYLMRQAARATSAAPSYFEPVQIRKKTATNTFVDGGVVANNPAMCAYVEARKMFPGTENILVVSLGAGDLTRPLPYAEAKEWGLAQWLAPLFSLVMDGMSDSVDYQMRQLMPSVKDEPRSYYRFQATLTEGSDDIDDATRTNIRVLKMITQDLISTNTNAIDELCSQLTAE
ncbi:MAG TPA: patatin-like phospholipase family protein, partial [Anaerolineales bacterium]|nr:patatin-like phospholipase family protein [Anaerolineales bacterium]